MPRISAAQRRNDFIHAAVEVIAEHGIEGATTRRIAEQAKANLAMLHYCYDSKDDLFSDVYDFIAGRYRELLKATDPGASVEDTARQILRAVMEFYVESPNFAAATLELITWARRQHGNRGVAVYDQASETLRAALREAPPDHRIDDEAIDRIAFVIGSLSDGFALNWLVYEDKSRATEQMEILEAALDGWISRQLKAAPATV